MSEFLHIVCPQCNALNKIAQARLMDSPNCGKCHKPLFSSQPYELSANNFNRYIAKNDIPVLVDFWAPWCGPCKTMGPAFKQAASILEPKVRLVKVNTEAEQNIAAQYNIRSIPTLMLFVNGKELARQPGALGMDDIVRWVNSQL